MRKISLVRWTTRSTSTVPEKKRESPRDLFPFIFFRTTVARSVTSHLSASTWRCVKRHTSLFACVRGLFPRVPSFTVSKNCYRFLSSLPSVACGLALTKDNSSEYVHQNNGTAWPARSPAVYRRRLCCNGKDYTLALYSLPRWKYVWDWSVHR